MFEKIKTTVKSTEFRNGVKSAAINIASTIVVAVVIKAGTYIVVEGTKALIAEMTKDKSAE
jgi:hypothetical protein